MLQKGFQVCEENLTAPKSINVKYHRDIFLWWVLENSSVGGDCNSLFLPSVIFLWSYVALVNKEYYWVCTVLTEIMFLTVFRPIISYELNPELIHYVHQIIMSRHDLNLLG